MKDSGPNTWAHYKSKVESRENMNEKIKRKNEKKWTCDIRREKKRIRKQQRRESKTLNEQVSFGYRANKRNKDIVTQRTKDETKNIPTKGKYEEGEVKPHGEAEHPGGTTRRTKGSHTIKEKDL